MAERMFPVLQPSRYEGTPKYVPWGLLAPHERQAQINHSQSLQRLAERGGLGIEEMYAILRDADFYAAIEVSGNHAVEYVNERVRLYLKREAEYGPAK